MAPLDLNDVLCKENVLTKKIFDSDLFLRWNETVKTTESATLQELLISLTETERWVISIHWKSASALSKGQIFDDCLIYEKQCSDSEKLFQVLMTI